MQVKISTIPHKVIFERGGLRHWAAFLPSTVTGGALITDETVYRHQKSNMMQTKLLAPLIIPTEEQAKQLEVAATCWQQLHARRVDRHGIVVAMGGGCTSDLAGFVAACYMRGIPWINLPTTLLAMVDASLGGKTGINLPTGKNLVGAFHQPELVLIDPEALETLPTAQFWDGMAEVIKHGVIRDPALFALLEQRLEELPEESDLLDQVIQRAAEIKLEVVAADEREQGVRAHLNYGHTFGHAVEGALNFSINHGGAVAIGMSCAAHLAARLGWIDHQFVERQDQLLRRAHLPIQLPPEVDDQTLLTLMHGDKKAVGTKLTFVLPRQFGQVETINDVEEQEVLAALQAKRKEDSDG